MYSSRLPTDNLFHSPSTSTPLSASLLDESPLTRDPFFHSPNRSTSSSTYSSSYNRHPYNFYSTTPFADTLKRSTLTSTPSGASTYHSSAKYEPLEEKYQSPTRSLSKEFEDRYNSHNFKKSTTDYSSPSLSSKDTHIVPRQDYDREYHRRSYADPVSDDLIPSFSRLMSPWRSSDNWLDRTLTEHTQAANRLFEREFSHMDSMVRDMHRMSERMIREAENLQSHFPEGVQSSSSSYSTTVTHNGDGKSHSHIVRSECRRVGDLMEESTSFVDSNGNQRTTTKRAIGADQVQEVTIDRNSLGEERKLENLHGIRQDEVESFQAKWRESAQRLDPNQKLLGGNWKDSTIRPMLDHTQRLLKY